MFPGDMTDDLPCWEITWNKRATRSTGHKARSLEQQRPASQEPEDIADYDLALEDPGLNLGLDKCSAISPVSSDLPLNVCSIPTLGGEPPISEPHLLWHCAVSDFSDTSENPHLPVTAMMDIGSPFVLIRPETVIKANLRICKLPEPIVIDTATPSLDSRSSLTDFVYVQLHNINNLFSACRTHALITPSLCTDIILSLPFLSYNDITISSAHRSAIHEPSGFNLLHPVLPPLPPPRKRTLKDSLLDTHRNIVALHTELKSHCTSLCDSVDARCEPVKPFDMVAAVQEHIECLAIIDHCSKLEVDIKKSYEDIFQPLPHVDEMPDKVTCKIELKNAEKSITSRSYACPCKFRQAWQTLIKQHLDTGRIRESSSPHASPAFLIPKPDSNVLPCWVNDYRELNKNIVTDRYLLHQIDDILADAGNDKIWSKLDMTDSFFHTKMHLDSIPLTAVSTPFGLYEQTVMPQGMKNLPSVHQCHVNDALHDFIGKICHIYLDNIII